MVIASNGLTLKRLNSKIISLEISSRGSVDISKATKISKIISTKSVEKIKNCHTYIVQISRYIDTSNSTYTIYTSIFTFLCYHLLCTIATFILNLFCCLSLSTFYMHVPTYLF